MSIKKSLTARQSEVYEYIKSSLESKGRPPTVREIGDRFQITSTNGVRSILSALIKKGYIRRTPKVSRGIDIISQKQFKPELQSNLVEIPIIGRVAAGSPVLAVENLEGTVVVEKDFLMRRSDVIALRVKGDSMKDAGILDGDLVFARRQPFAEAGQIVVALIGDEATVKHFFPEADHIRLEPANPAYRPIIIDSSTPDFRIAGRVIGIQRQYK